MAARFVIFYIDYLLYTIAADLQLDLSIVWRTLKRPTGAANRLFAQFFWMPLVSGKRLRVREQNVSALFCSSLIQ